MLTFEMWKSFLTDGLIYDEFVSYSMLDVLTNCNFILLFLLLTPLILLVDIILLPFELVILIKHIVKR